jgi:hypothetical protein
MAPPTMARISAYSAADAPDWSLIILMKIMSTVLPTLAVRSQAERAAPCSQKATLNMSGPLPWNRVNRQ